MKSKIRKTLLIIPAACLCITLLYSGIYLYFRHDNWIEHDDFSRYINYSTGFIYNGHKVHLKRQYEDDYQFAPVELVTRPGRWAEEKFWEIKEPKGSPYPEEWKLPLPDRDWFRVLQIGKSRSLTAYSELEAISKTNKDLPSGKLAATMIQLWDLQLKTFILSKPRAIIEIPWYATDGIGIYDINVLVKKNGTARKASISRRDERKKAAEEIAQHTLYCPAKDAKDYLEAEYETMRIVCGFYY